MNVELNGNSRMQKWEYVSAVFWAVFSWDIQYSLKISHYVSLIGTSIYPLLNQHNYGTSPFYSWENSRFQWQLSMSQTVFMSGYQVGSFLVPETTIFH